MTAKGAREAAGDLLQSLNAVTAQTVTLGGASSAASAAFGATTTCIRIITPVACFYKLGAAPTAAGTDHYIPAGIAYDVSVVGGEKIAFLDVAGASTGTVYITENG